MVLDLENGKSSLDSQNFVCISTGPCLTDAPFHSKYDLQIPDIGTFIGNYVIR